MHTARVGGLAEAKFAPRDLRQHHEAAARRPALEHALLPLFTMKMSSGLTAIAIECSRGKFSDVRQLAPLAEQVFCKERRT